MDVGLRTTPVDGSGGGGDGLAHHPHAHPPPPGPPLPHLPPPAVSLHHDAGPGFHTSQPESQTSSHAPLPTPLGTGGYHGLPDTVLHHHQYGPPPPVSAVSMTPSGLPRLANHAPQQHTSAPQPAASSGAMVLPSFQAHPGPDGLHHPAAGDALGPPPLMEMKGRFPCEICGQDFARRYDLRAHVRVHTGERPYKCSMCNKSFTISTTLRRHERTHTGVKPHKCETCGKSFTRKVHLRDHQRIHTGDSPFTCQICNKPFVNSSTLRAHKRVHAGTYSCVTCGQAFTQLGHLREHERVHTGEKPYKCSVCDKAFTQASNLRRHKRVHSGDKPHKCPVCSKGFTQSWNLQRHEKVHVNDTARRQLAAAGGSSPGNGTAGAAPGTAAAGGTAGVNGKTGLPGQGSVAVGISELPSAVEPNPPPVSETPLAHPPLQPAVPLSHEVYYMPPQLAYAPLPIHQSVPPVVPVSTAPLHFVMQQQFPLVQVQQPLHLQQPQHPHHPYSIMGVAQPGKSGGQTVAAEAPEQLHRPQHDPAPPGIEDRDTPPPPPPQQPDGAPPPPPPPPPTPHAHAPLQYAAPPQDTALPLPQQTVHAPGLDDQGLSNEDQLVAQIPTTES